MIALLGATGTAYAHFTDDFARADNAALGNGWVEKAPAAFSLVGGAARKQAVTSWYRDNAVYRPAGEDVLNVEASLEFRIFATPPGYPQLLARVQSATAATPDRLDGYVLYFSDTGTSAILGRQTGGDFVATLATLTLSTALNTIDQYRMRLSAVGTNPVVLDAYVERLVSGVWVTIGQATFNDTAANRIASAGSVGFGGYVESSYSFDNFARVDLGAVGTANPAPTTSGLAPQSAMAGEGDLLLVVYGSGFTTDSVVRWNGVNRTTTYVSPSELEALIPAASLAAPGTAPVTVFNPAPGGGVSAAQTFTIGNPGAMALTLASIVPSSAIAGTAGFTLVANGTGFTAASTVRWNGTNRTTTFISSTELRATITAADIATAGSANVTVFRSSDNSTSAPRPFTIDAPTPPSSFVDDFNRADGAAIGNGWVKKNAAAFTLVGGEADKQAVVSGYRDNIVYRPAAENILDVEASIEIRFNAAQIGYPQLLVRGQTATIATADRLDGYVLYFDDNNARALLGRQNGTAFVTTLATINLSSPVNMTDRFRMRLNATGTTTVNVTGYIEQLVGSVWTLIGSATFSDTSASRISTAGSVGFSGYVEATYRFDNFRRVPISGAPNPVPTTTGLSPSSATAGSAATNVTVNGTGFVVGSTVRWNGVNRTTTFISATQLQVQIPAADLANPGTANVTVFTPEPGGATSNAQVFTISSPTTNPVPSIASLNPTSALAGGGSFTLIVQGGGFVNGSTVRWNGSNRATTFFSSGEVRATITAADVASAGTRAVTVFSPTPGGGTSNSVNFTVTANNPLPVISSISPASATAGSPAFTLTVLGSNFTSGSTVRWNGSNRSTTFISAGEVRGSISASDIAATGTGQVTVFTPAPGGGTSAVRNFTITSPGSSNPVPALTQVTPNRAGPGSPPTVVSVFGSGFNASSIVRYNGADRPTTLISGTQLNVTLSSADLAATALGSISVVNPAPGGGSSTPEVFFVQDASLAAFTDNFNRADNEVVGNSWTEKNPVAFFVSGNTLSSRRSDGFQSDMMYRPQSEDRRDVELSVEFIRQPNDPILVNANFPQIHARIQRAGLEDFNQSSYIFFMDDTRQQPRAMYAINYATPQLPNSYECYIAPLPLSTPLVTGNRYRLRFRITGTSPVVLTGTVEQYSNGVWSSIANSTIMHSGSFPRDPDVHCDGPTVPPPITDAGAVGIAKWVNRTDTYDNFAWRELPVTGTTPSITTLNPSSVAVGGAAFELRVLGSGFAANSQIRWNGAARTTTYISQTELRATIAAADVATSGSALVTVFSPDSSSTSNAATFQISPASATETLFDTFARADNAALGNGWIEKTPAAFSIVGQRAQKLLIATGDYRDNIVYRPGSESTLNNEALMEFRLTGAPVGYPQLLVRVQTATANMVGGFEGYMLYLPDSTGAATLARQLGAGWDEALGSFALSQSLNTTDTYRMRLSAVGTNPVRLQASIERWTGSAWQALGQTSYDDSSPSRIQNAGAVGFSGYVENTYWFDNFRRIDLGQ